ncbi:Archaeal/vacuolar-type H+-ATPase subunit E [Thermoplasmatales archaeon BRNA1]|nr:Archaeal/vacuolar-type H+-ATPase subunit E [Thermoplasmatales archaeon BRNA1]
MALDSVTKEIEASAQASVAKLREEQAAEIKAINEQADAEIAEMKEKQEKRISETKDMLARQERSSADLESKKIVLAKKKEILNRAFESALVELENMPASKKKAYYKAMVKAAKKIIPEPKALMSENDSFTASDLGVTAVEKDSKIRSGLILQSADGSLEVDMQYSVLLQNIWDSNLKQLSDILFG